MNDIFKKLKNVFNYISKIISTAVLVLLILIGMFLVYYLISAKKYANTPGYQPKVSLYTIISGSMEPNIRVYDVVIDVAVSSPEKIKKGDVITFKSSGGISKGLIVTHRVVDIKLVNGKYEYVTKGDWNATIDTDTAKFENIIGKVVLRIPQLGRLQFFLASKMGWFIVVLLPAMGVIIYDLIKVFKLISAKKNVDKLLDSKQSNNDINKELNEAFEKIKKNDYLNNIDKLRNINDEKND